MKNIAVIFAGGTGQRMNTRTVPKQFLKLHEKPILVYTLEQFQYCREIDGIVVVMLERWIDYCRELCERYRLTKVSAVVAGGENGQASIYHGIKKAAEIYGEENIVLIHDGVRPLIDEETICANIESVRDYGSAVTITPAIETIITEDERGMIDRVVDRKQCRLARAPQSFILRDILSAHERSIAAGMNNFIDSATMMRHYGYTLHTVEGKPENIKITTPSDYYIFKALIDARENSEILGV